MSTPRPDIVAIPEMPARMQKAGMRPLTEARLRQLALTEEFPPSVYERGRLRLWLWPEVETYLRTRKLSPGRRTDLENGDS